MAEAARLIMVADKHQRRLGPASELLQHRVQGHHRQSTPRMPKIACSSSPTSFTTRYILKEVVVSLVHAGSYMSCCKCVHLKISMHILPRLVFCHTPKLPHTKEQDASVPSGGLLADTAQNFAARVQGLEADVQVRKDQPAATLQR